MHKTDLEHIIRAASAVTNEYEVVVVGSQSILGSVDFPPPECLVSMEADILVLGSARASDLIDGAIGEGSPFHDSFGYYAQGVDETTSTLPAGWQGRLKRLQSQNTDGKIGYCLDVTDLFLAKCHANREKDRDFNVALLRHGLVDPEVAAARVASMPLDAAGQARIGGLILRLQKEAVHSVERPSAANAPDSISQLDGDHEAGALERALREQGIDVRSTRDDVEYIGRIRQITESGLMVQGISRTAVVVHRMNKLEGEFAVGQLAEIKYESDRGRDMLQAPGRAIGGLGRG